MPTTVAVTTASAASIAFLWLAVLDFLAVLTSVVVARSARGRDHGRIGCSGTAHGRAQAADPGRGPDGGGGRRLARRHVAASRRRHRLHAARPLRALPWRENRDHAHGGARWIRRAGGGNASGGRAQDRCAGRRGGGRVVPGLRGGTAVAV